jgi:hypothetical protein
MQSVKCITLFPIHALAVAPSVALMDLGTYPSRVFRECYTYWLGHTMDPHGYMFPGIILVQTVIQGPDTSLEGPCQAQ